MTRRKANPGQRPFMVSGDSMKRIAAAVQGYEHGNRKQSAVHFRTATGDDGGGIRLGKIDEGWSKGETATVRRYRGDGTEIENAQFDAVNRFADVSVGSGGEVWVACAMIDSTWHLIAAEC
jgi:hypothetical protein